MKKELDVYKNISCHRNAIMGFSAIIITIYHYWHEFNSIPAVNVLFKYGSVGVDMFMFLTGFGLYVSLNKTDSDGIKAIPSFYKRRFLRLFSSYIPFIFIWFLFMSKSGGITLPQIFGNVFCTGYFLPAKGYFNWYMTAIAIFYVLFPLPYFIMSKTQSRDKGLVCALFVAATTVVTFFLRQDIDTKEISRSIIIVVRTIPLFFGMFFGARFTERKKQSLYTTLIFAFLFIIGCVLIAFNDLKLNDYIIEKGLNKNGFAFGLQWFAFGLVAPFLCTIVSWAFMFIQKYFKPIYLFSDYIGKMSLELYLTHIFIIEYIFADMNRKNFSQWLPEPLNLFVTLVLSIVTAIILKMIGKIILNSIKNLFKERKLNG